MGGPDLVTLGETMALFAPETGTLAEAEHVRLFTAGAESNVAIGVVRLGLTACWIGRTGDDQLGERVRRDLGAAGLDLRVHSDPEAPTGLMIKEPDGAGRVRIRYHRRGSAGSRLGPDDLEPGLIERSSWLHLTGITPALSDSARDAVYAAAGRADAAGVPYSVDLNLRRTLWASTDDFVDAVRPLVGRATVVFAGADEAATLLGVDGLEPLELARALAALGPQHAVIKGGAGETVAVVDGTPYRHPAFDIEVVDTVGAGDAFVAGYLAGLLTDPSDIPVVLRIASACGAYACTTLGDWEALPTPAELQSFLRTARPRPLGPPLSDDVLR